MEGTYGRIAPGRRPPPKEGIKSSLQLVAAHQLQKERAGRDPCGWLNRWVRALRA